MAEASDVVPEMTTISVSGARSLIARIASRPDSLPSVRSTMARSKAPSSTARRASESVATACVWY